MGEEEIILSDHARRQLNERKIPIEWIKLTVQFPTKLVLYADKYFTYKRFGKLYLKIIFARVEGKIIIITQHFVKKLP